jgi:hypothetical protein
VKKNVNNVGPLLAQGSLAAARPYGHMVHVAQAAGAGAHAPGALTTRWALGVARLPTASPVWCRGGGSSSVGVAQPTQWACSRGRGLTVEARRR